MAEENGSYGGKRPIWQWILVYAVIGIVVYGLIYYFVLAKKGGSVYSPTSGNTQDTIVLTVDGFSPATLTVKAGTKVTWINQSNTGATVNSNPHPIHTDYQPLNLGNFPDNGTLSLTFDKPGTYGYHNHLNPSQSGTITVQ